MMEHEAKAYGKISTLWSNALGRGKPGGKQKWLEYNNGGLGGRLCIS